MTVVRRANLGDATALARVHVAAWEAAYRGVMPDAFLDGLDVGRWADRWRQTLGGARGPEHTPEAVLVVEVEGGPPVGFAMTGHERPLSPLSEARGELWAINIAPEAWGQGLGRLLLRAAEQALADAGHRDAVLWVLAANPRARRFYERAGWYADGAVKRDTQLGFEIHEVRYARGLKPL
ncbi:MAG TPA: GNAT family N-acetyltransferase [Candidatus Limnocylindria bacterium]|nr:GNAT family N-acetyltransferase [Candidatus Limnocylindria bacterium]